VLTIDEASGAFASGARSFPASQGRKELDMRSRAVRFLTVLIFLASSAAAAAQGLQTGALSGRVTMQDGTLLPGAAVTIRSAALQGVQSATTDVNGVFLFRGLPPGRYLMTFEMDGLTTIEREADVPLGGTAVQDATLSLAPVQETVVVTAQAPPALEATHAATNAVKAEIDALPIGRTPFAIAELAPGLTDNTPNASQLAIAGAFAYDNVFLVNGVDVNDNVLGSANGLFIEDAVQEVQVLTSGLPAEYGRFSGGVVNVITRSGGNDFAGSFRATFTNPSWTTETPYERSRDVERTSKLSTYYEGTLGGPIVRNRLWFFGAGRFEQSEAQSAYAQTGIPYATSTDNARYEAKFTWTPRPAQRLQGVYLDNQTDLAQPALSFAIDPAAYTHPSTPNRMVGASYQGVLASRLFATVQYSQKWYGIRDQGGTSTAIVDSPFLTRTGSQYLYNAPYFDSSDPEDRDNSQMAGSLAYFVSSRRAGSHDVKAGIERFTSTRVGGNSQSSTGYVFRADYAKNADGTPALDASGRLIPRFQTGLTQMQTWMPVRGATIDVHTTSVYVADHWAAGRHWTFDLGLRYEHARSEATGDIDGARGDVLTPRLAASYDVQGDGRTVLQATYAHYSGKYNDVQFSRNTNVGNADRISGVYTGPAGQGRDFAAGFDPANYTTIGGTFPTANIFFDDSLSSPITREFTVAAGRELGRGLFVKAIYVRRSMDDFVEDFITIDNGQTTIIRDGVNFGTFDNVVYRNSSEPARAYQALELVSSYRRTSRLLVSGHWTVQIENDGNFEGEGRNTPAVSSLAGDYPEMLILERNFPIGRLAGFQRHKVRLWGVYNLALGRFGSVDVAPVYRYNSALTYSLTAAGVLLSSWQLSQNPGYARLPGGGRQTIFFGERGVESFEGYHLVDLGLTYAVPVWRELSPWIKVEVLNALNNQTLISWDTTVTASMAGPVDQYGLPTAYTKSATFGQATGTTSYPRPRPGMDGGRTVMLAVGVRF
jgi:hypothetical protein